MSTQVHPMETPLITSQPDPLQFALVEPCSHYKPNVTSSGVLTTLENLEISGNLLILENSGDLKFSRNLSDVCIIVSNSTLNWLGGTVTGVDGASHRAP